MINSESDLLLANRDYAICGITTTVDCAAVCIKGPDTGNVRIGVPGADLDLVRGPDYFCNLSREQSMSLIPMINSGNRNSTEISFLQNENNVNVPVTIYLALLKK